MHLGGFARIQLENLREIASKQDCFWKIELFEIAHAVQKMTRIGCYD
jgi:hypothetical protein